jgi:hypothetical protein
MPFTLTRSLLVILIPGAIAILPWFTFILMRLDVELVSIKEFKAELGILLFLCAVIIGGIFEGLNSFVEVCLDNCRHGANRYLFFDWYEYLCAHRDKEPVAFRYISSRATTMYFEFSMAWASPACGYGITRVLKDSWLAIDYLWLIIFISWLVGAYFFYQGTATHLVLCKVRRELSKGLRKKNKSKDAF